MPLNSSRGAPRILAGRYLAGLTWRRLISEGHPSSLARLRAIEERAAWYAHDGLSPTVGLACLAPADARRRHGSLHALAIVAARAFSAGRVFLVLRADAGWWIATVLNGIPDGLDALVDSAEQVQAHFQQELLRGPFDAVHGDPESGLAGCQPWAASQCEPFESPASRMQAARRRLPQWLGAAALMLLVAWGARAGLAHWRGLRQPAPSLAVPAADVEAAWRKAFQAWRRSIARPTNADLTALRQAVHALPIDVGGWAFESLNCGWQTSWSCTALYRRSDSLARRATNRSFEAVRPRAWTLAWTSATQVRASFSVSGEPSASVDPAGALPSLAEYQIETFSDLQVLGQLFAHAEVSGVQRLEIPAASGVDGQALPRPKSGTVPEVFRAALTLTGPLRNLEVVEQAGIPARWREFSVTRNEQDQVSLRLSALTMTLKGEVHARQS
ncbi:MAG: hypothetical protein Q8N17_11730 [Burkholderiaceae bacterium]|nr:hypothetical protein [Burkholderiaceae bacterium]